MSGLEGFSQVDIGPRHGTELAVNITLNNRNIVFAVFSAAAIEALGKCVSVRVLHNPETKQVAFIPGGEGGPVVPLSAVAGRASRLGRFAFTRYWKAIGNPEIKKYILEQRDNALILSYGEGAK